MIVTDDVILRRCSAAAQPWSQGPRQRRLPRCNSRPIPAGRGRQLADRQVDFITDTGSRTPPISIAASVALPRIKLPQRFANRKLNHLYIVFAGTPRRALPIARGSRRKCTIRCLIFKDCVLRLQESDFRDGLAGRHDDLFPAPST
jgi:hypothetical protein